MAKLESDHVYAEELEVLRYTLSALYTLISLVAIFQLIRVKIRHEKRKSSKPNALYFMVFLCSAIRGVYNWLPISVWNKVYVLSTGILQIICDLLPEVTFFSTYLLLLLVWVEMYHFSKAIKDAHRIARRLWIAYAAINFIVFGVILIIAIVVGSPGPFYNSQGNLIEGIYVATLSIALAIAFPVYGVLLFRTLSKTAISSNRKQIMVRKLLRLLIACITCFLAHAIYSLLLDAYLAKEIRNLRSFPYIWFAYFFLTEVLPIALILFLLRGLTKPKKQYRPLISKKNKSAEEEVA